LFNHELRWFRTIRGITPLGLAASFITHPVGLSILALGLSGFAMNAWLVLGAALAARWALVYTCNRRFGLTPMAMPLIPVRDILSLALLIASFCGQRVTWRDRSFEVGRTGELTLEGDPLA